MDSIERIVRDVLGSRNVVSVAAERDVVDDDDRYLMLRVVYDDKKFHIDPSLLSKLEDQLWDQLMYDDERYIPVVSVISASDENNLNAA